MSPTKSQSRKKVTLKIPTELYENLAELIEDTGFRSVTEFAVYALRDVVATGKQRDDSPGTPRRETQSFHDRLRALGYLD